MDFLFSSLLVPTAITALVGGLMVAGAYDIRRRNQHSADHMRTTWEITFGGEMKMEAVYGFLHALSGLDKPTLLGAIHTVSFERYAHGTDIERFFVHVPGHMTDRVNEWMEDHLDVGFDVVPAEDDPVENTTWEAAMELEFGSGELDVVDPIQQGITVGSRFRHMAENEQLVTQVVIFPARRQTPTPETKGKQSSNTFHAIIRVAGNKPERPELMVKDVVSGFQSLDNERAFFRKRNIRNVGERLNHRIGMMEFPSLLNEKELLSVITWPLSGSTIVAARKLAPTSAHDQEGIILGESNSSRAKGRKIAIPVEGVFTHMSILGPTKSGKSVLLLNIGLEAIRNNLSLTVIEPAGDLVNDFLDRIPKDRVKDVILLDPTDTAWPVGIQVLSGSDPERTRGHLVSMFKSLSPDSWGPRLERFLGNTIYTAALNGLTFYDLRPLLTNKHFRDEEVKKISRAKYPYVREEWDLFDKLPDNGADSIINKVNAFLGYETVRNIVAQKKGLDFDAIIRQGKILLVPLPPALIGEAGARAIGQLVMELLWDAAMRQRQGDRMPSMVIADEWQNYAGGLLSSSDRFAEARKFRQAYVVANQYSKQIDDAKIRETVKMNVQNQIVFRLSPEDAENVGKVYHPFKAAEIAALPQYSVVGRLMGSQGYTPPVTWKTDPPPPVTGFRRQIIANTRANYARPVEEVRAEIAAKHKGPEPRPIPKFGVVEDE